MNNFSTRAFIEAINDYFFLLNRGYPEKAGLKLVGNRHRLSGNQRNCLYRGITSRLKARNRKSKLTQNLKNQFIHIDGYNVMFTIMNYLLGKTTFIANDGLMRDSGAAYGKIEDEKIFFRAAHLLFDYLSGTHARETIIYLDTTVENCENHKMKLETERTRHNSSGTILLLKHADTRLKEIKDGIVATSDSEIIDSFSGRIVDAARQTLRQAFKIKMTDLKSLLRYKKQSR